MKKKARRKEFHANHHIRIFQFGIPLRWGLFIDDRRWVFNTEFGARYALHLFSSMKKEKFDALDSEPDTTITMVKGHDHSMYVPVRIARNDLI